MSKKLSKSRPESKSSTYAAQKRNHSDFSDDISDDEQQSLGEEDVALDGDEELDADAPRIAQWEPDDEVEDDGGLSEESGQESESIPIHNEGRLASLRDSLSTLPFSSLLKARRKLAQAQAEDSSSQSQSEDSASDSELDNEPKPSTSKSISGKPEWDAKPRTDIKKRSNKNAPVEMTAKKPVTRRRTVVDVHKIEAKDPRFLSVTGELSKERFKSNYSFLSELHNTELSELKYNLKRANKLLASSPRNLREEREEEVRRLELAVKTAESMVNRDRKEKIEDEALRKVSSEEKEKRKSGKASWWMKDSAKKELLLKARYDALAASGGKFAVKKAIEKKQKKQSQKEKRSRPFSAPSGSRDRSNTEPDRSRQRIPGSATVGGPPRKRQRTRK